MKRWNGWGDSAINFELTDSILDLIGTIFGDMTPTQDMTPEDILTGIPDSPIPDSQGLNINKTDRLNHSRGQSFPDWIALRHGNIRHFPDAVAYPENHEDIQNVIQYAEKNKAAIIPYGGGTSVCGHINPSSGPQPVITLDMSRMNQLLFLDEFSGLATFGAGITGKELENVLNSRSWTLGHYPQSFELSTLGGWIATRSSGHQSLHYGRIEDMFAGGKVETGQGTFNLLEFPASAAGPDMKQLILGSEGRFGVITRATMRVHKLPESERFYGTLFKNWDAGMNAVKETVQRNTQLSMMRLSDPVETEINFRLSGKKQAEFLKERFLPRFGFGNETSLLLFGITGDKKTVHQTRKKARSIFRSHGSSPLIEYLGKSWYRKRFHIPYVRNALWDAGLGLDTLETAVSWSKVNDMTVMVKTAIESAMEKMNQRVLVFFHLSHIYPDGASVYVTYLFKRCQNPDELHCRWQEMKSAASKTIVKLGGTISHQHGVGIDHKPYLQSEKGVLGISAIRAAKTVFDPNSIFNPGKLVD